MTSDWKQLTKTELELAEKARRAGNEGRARVCARRAAGIVSGEYLARNGINLKTDSALQKLRYLEAYPGISPEEIEIVNHFLVHITPEHKHPVDADLIANVHLLIHLLLNDSLE